MAIIATSKGSQRELIPAGNYIARCYKMIHIGTVQDSFGGETKLLNKVRISWELPTETRVFNEEKGEQPLSIDKEYTLSMHEKATLRKDLESWRGKSFTDEEVEAFDIIVLMDKYCMLNVIHVESKKGSTYDKVSSIAPVVKGLEKPDAVNEIFIFDYDDHFNMDAVEELPDFIKKKIKLSEEYRGRLEELNSQQKEKEVVHAEDIEDDDLPF